MTHPSFDAGVGLATVSCARCGASVVATFAARVGEHGSELLCRECNRNRKGKR
jgi:hypothetical protein